MRAKATARGIRESGGAGDALGDRARRRQGHGDGRADALLALDGERAAMELDEADRERQAQSGAGMAPAPWARDLAEPRDRGFDLGTIHADAVIGNRDVIAVVVESRRQGDMRAALAELHRIGDEVEQHLLEL